MKELHRAYSEVLYWVWDPIGVNHDFCARGEYDAYVPSLVAIAMSAVAEDVKAARMKQYLVSVSSEQMGTGARHTKAEATVRRLLNASEAVNEGIR